MLDILTSVITTATTTATAEAPLLIDGSKSSFSILPSKLLGSPLADIPELVPATHGIPIFRGQRDYLGDGLIPPTKRKRDKLKSRV